MNISNFSECDEEYAEGLTDLASLTELRDYLKKWDLVAHDAVICASKMREDQWEEFKAGLDLERKGQFSGEKWNEKYIEILLPSILFQVSWLKSQFSVPWGAAYFRMKDLGKV